MPDIIAHRGRGMPHLSENTIASLDALGSWVAGVEIDPRISSDDVVVLMHDATTDRTTGSPGTVADMTGAQLTELWAGNDYVPTLAAYLAACSGKGFRWIVLDTKITDVTGLGIIWDVAMAAPADVRAAIVWGSTSAEVTTNIRTVSSDARISRFGASAGTVTAVLAEMYAADGEMVFTRAGQYATDRDIVQTVQGTDRPSGDRFLAASGTNNNLATLELARTDGCDAVLTDRSDDLAHWVAPPTPPGPPPAPGPEPVAVAAITQAVHWQGINDLTGRVIADLPDLTGETSRLLMAYTSSRLELPLAESGPGGLPIQVVEQATQPQGCSIVQIVNDVPVWAGRVLVRSGGSGPKMVLGVASSEQYLLHRRVTGRSFVGVDRAAVAAALLTDAGSTPTGSGMALDVDAVPVGDVVDRDYLDTDLLTVYQALRELSEAGTLEWTIDYDWADATSTVLRRIMRLRRRIGRTGAAYPVFDTAKGCTYTLIEDYSTGRYANTVIVYGDGEGADLPRSAPQVDQAALDAGVPIVEHALHVRDIADGAELDHLAAAQLARLKAGAQLWEIESPQFQWPRLGLDAALGDEASWRFASPRHPSPDGTRPGVEGSGRIIGWSLDAAAALWRPKLLDPQGTAVGSG